MTAKLFDAERLTAIPAGQHGAWIELQPKDGDSSWPAGDQVLVIDDPGLQSFSLFPVDAPPVLNAGLLRSRDGWDGHGRIGFPIDGPSPAKAPLLLRIEPGRVIASPTRFSLVSPQQFRREDARWLALATACFSIMAAMAVMALLFAIELRDMTFVYYAGYVLAYALILAVQTGYVAEPLEWTWIAGAPNTWGRAATAISILFATLFVARFAELTRYAPRMRIVVLALGAATCALMALGSVPVAGLIRAASLLINPLLIFAGPLILIASVMAWMRGSRYAGFFLLGWTPLLAVTVLGSAQVFGVLATWTWLGDSNLVAGAFEALVLSLGLADRALSLRRDRDIAQALADTDALTSTLNRRGLDRSLEQMVERAHRQRQPLTLLFLDLDRFKLLNDRRGHAAGDEALIAVTRLMRSDMRVQDVLGRYGGEEFIAALPGCSMQIALEIAERIRTDLQALRIAVGSPEDVLTASIGLACLQRGLDANALIADADRAMYAAKRSGGNRVETVTGPTMATEPKASQAG
ncbi:MAG: diguanylate cyclase [Lysobacteraceae bacterium]